MKVIGVIGLNGSGKDEVVKYLNQKYGVPLISVGDIVRALAAAQGIEPTRDNLDLITQNCFAQYGEGYFVKQIIEKIRQNQWRIAGISGIRSPADIEAVRQAIGVSFILINVYVSDPRVRYERVRQRGSQRDRISYQDFIRQDHDSENIFHIQAAAGLANYSLANDGTLATLHQEIDALVAKGLLE
jgi:dephospho-CoA kinase